MSQTTVTNFDKAAVLITSLSPGAQDKVLELLGPDFAGKLRPILTAVSRRKDFGSLTEQVLQEFRELQAEVRASVSGSPNLQRTDVDTSSATSAPDAQSLDKSEPTADQSDSKTTDEKSESTESSNPSGEAPAGLEALMKLSPVVLGAGLKRESPRMIATVLKQLPAEFTGRVLEVLPPEIRQSTFLLMADTVQVNPAVVRRIMQKLCEVCQTIDPAEVEQQDRRLKSLIGILQSVEREERIRLLESLTERDPELATQIDNLMYDFTDVMRLEDRSIQKLLSQLEQKIVAMALKTAPEDLRQKVLKNLSERVRAALNEEMELLATVPPSKAEAARREVANVIRAQDKEGTLVWLE
ncbi:MAG: FliG C-terminal domain-containing protein [Planctomycetaceae bacterium]